MKTTIQDRTIDSGIDEMPDSLIVRLYDDGEDLDTSVGGNAVIIDDDDIEGEYSIYDVDENPNAFYLEGDEERGYLIRKKAEQSA